MKNDDGQMGTGGKLSGGAKAGGAFARFRGDAPRIVPGVRVDISAMRMGGGVDGNGMNQARSVRGAVS